MKSQYLLAILGIFLFAFVCCEAGKIRQLRKAKAQVESAEDDSYDNFDFEDNKNEAFSEEDADNYTDEHKEASASNDDVAKKADTEVTTEIEKLESNGEDQQDTEIIYKRCDMKCEAWRILKGANGTFIIPVNLGNNGTSVSNEIKLANGTSVSNESDKHERFSSDERANKGTGPSVLNKLKPCNSTFIRNGPKKPNYFSVKPRNKKRTVPSDKPKNKNVTDSTASHEINVNTDPSVQSGKTQASVSPTINSDPSGNPFEQMFGFVSNKVQGYLNDERNTAGIEDAFITFFRSLDNGKEPIKKT